MAKITLDTDQLKDLFFGDNPMRVLLEEVQGKVLDAKCPSTWVRSAINAQRSVKPTARGF